MVVAVAANAHWKNQSLQRPVAPELVVRVDQFFMANPSRPRKGVLLLASPYAIPYLQGYRQRKERRDTGARLVLWG
jgi:hypothetical protein